MQHIKYFLPSFVILAVAIALVTLWPGTPVHANPFYVGSKAKSAIATTTVAYMTPGTATTTVQYDSYEINGTNQTNGGNLTLPDSIAFALQGNASSSISVINVTCEFGDDETGATGVTSIDWYQNGIVGATTTNSGVQNIGTTNSFSFTYASTTVGGAPISTTTTRFAKVVVCPVPTRYVRAVVTITGANASVWVGIIPKKQRN